jgi:hypothetical protein
VNVKLLYQKESLSIFSDFAFEAREVTEKPDYGIVAT